MQDSFEIGRYRITTGPGHPSGSGIDVIAPSNNTFRSYTSGTDYYVNGSNLDGFAAVTLIGSTGIRTTYTLPGLPDTSDALTIVQDINVNGTTFADSTVEVTVTIQNDGADPVSVGVRYLWDYAIGNIAASTFDDGPTFQQEGPSGSVLTKEAEFSSPTFESYTIEDNDENPSPPTVTIHGTVTGPSNINPPPTFPDLLQYICWEQAIVTTFEYVVDVNKEVATDSSDCDNTGTGGDSGVLYYYGNSVDNAIQIASAEAASVSASVFATPAEPTDCIDPPSNLVSWWPGDGNADDYAYGNNGRVRLGAHFDAGKVNQAFEFDGIDDVVLVNNSQSLSFDTTSPITVDLWAYRTGSSPVMHFIGKRELGCGSFNYQMAFNNESGEGLVFNGDGGGVSTGIDLPLNTWTHLAGTFDGTEFKFYINGELAGTGSGTLGSPNTALLTIGNSSHGCEPFEGLIDEVEIFDRALSGSEIKGIFDADSAGKCKPIHVKIKALNRINLASQNPVIVTVITTPTFDASSVDPVTVRFGPTGTEAAPIISQLKDSDSDGDNDLVLKFNLSQTGISCGDTFVVLKGFTFGGESIQGSAAIRIVGCP